MKLYRNNKIPNVWQSRKGRHFICGDMSKAFLVPDAVNEIEFNFKSVDDMLGEALPTDSPVYIISIDVTCDFPVIDINKSVFVLYPCMQDEIVKMTSYCGDISNYIVWVEFEKANTGLVQIRDMKNGDFFVWKGDIHGLTYQMVDNKLNEPGQMKVYNSKGKMLRKSYFSLNGDEFFKKIKPKFLNKAAPMRDSCGRFTR